MDLPMSSEVAIRVSGLSKCYQIYAKPQDRLKQGIWRGRRRFYREFWALRDVSFEVKKGETVGIIGRNGSGKSTLLQMIAGTLAPSTGSVQKSGRTAALLELGSGFNPEFTGRENVYMNGAILGFSREEIRKRLADIAAFADIGDFIDQPVKTYSSGMLVRLAFAVSVNVDPELLIVDEALAVGDMAFQFKCLERLEKLTTSGTTLLFVSHDVGMVKAFCDRAIYLANGHIRATGRADEMAELYMLDIRDSQKVGHPQATQVKAKTSVGGPKGFAFGTDQGRITSAHFADTASTYSSYAAGEEVRLKVNVEFDQSVRRPALSILVQDRRMIPLTGKIWPIKANQFDADGKRRAEVLYSFPAKFAQGTYFITVRLEDRVTQSLLVPIDKQVGALSFDVFRPKSDELLGLVDLQVRTEELPG